VDFSNQFTSLKAEKTQIKIRSVRFVLAYVILYIREPRVKEIAPNSVLRQRAAGGEARSFLPRRFIHESQI